jgi:hypothetical protein
VLADQDSSDESSPGQKPGTRSKSVRGGGALIYEG